MNIKNLPIVTVDGPAASGKSSLSRELARLKNWNWLSTGAFYRGLAYVSLKKQTPLEDEKALAQLAVDSCWRVEMQTEKTAVFFGDQDVTEEIKKEEVGSYACQVSTLPMVREALLEAQRCCALIKPGLIAEGRDCGTVVFPKALLKIYLTANSKSRANRRALEQESSVKEVMATQARRDKADIQREASPLIIPEDGDAHYLDTSEMDLEQVVARAAQLLSEALSARS